MAPARAVADDAWQVALDNFRGFLPRSVGHWVLAFEPPYHERIAGDLCRLLDVVALISLGEDPPDRIGAIADAHRHEESCGFIELAATDAWEMDEADIAALMRFGFWPERRLRLCFQVSDANFPLLFSEGPDELGRRAGEIVSRLAGCGEIRLGANGRRAFRCSPGGWTPHVGSDPDDYMLPTGEVECVPGDASGELDVAGWIVGTLPFGRKYGRIGGGALTLQVREGRIERIGGSDARLIADLNLAFDRIPGLRTVSELGFGLSRGVARAAEDCAIGCLWHERHYGAHIGIGASLERDGRATNHHLDFVIAGGGIENASGETLLSW